jgi:hypothetical protein
LIAAFGKWHSKASDYAGSGNYCHDSSISGPGEVSVKQPTKGESPFIAGTTRRAIEGIELET